MEILKPLTVTTTTHALAISTYGGLFLLGVAQDVGAAHTLALEALVGERLVFVWSLLLTASALVCFVAALRAPKRGNPTTVMTVEKFAALALGLMLAVYEWSLAVDNGFTVPTTQIFVIMSAVGCFSRAIQIQRETRRVDKALKDVHFASPPPVAAPPDPRHGE